MSVGVSADMLVIQDNFLKFEMDYKSTQNVFSMIYKLMKTTKKANLENLNEQTYAIAESLVTMSEKYIETKSEILALDNDSSKLDKFIKTDILSMIEKNRGMLSDIEVRVKKLLDALVGKSVISEVKATKLLQKEEKADNSVIFVSKYETISSMDSPNYLIISYMKKYAVSFLLLSFLMFLLITDSFGTITNWLVNMLSSIGSTGSEGDLYTVSADPEAVNTLMKPLMTAVTTITSLAVMILVMFQTLKVSIDLLYITMPLFRPYLSQSILRNITESDYFGAEPLQITKFKLVRAKEILSAIRGLPEYKHSKLISSLSAKLDNKTVNSVLTLEDNYAIILVETLYVVVNTYYKSNRSIVDSCMGLTNTLSVNSMAVKVSVLRERLGL